MHKTPPPGTTRSAGEISAIMRRVHDRDTVPELAFRRALYARGLRYRVCANDLPGKPDVVFPRRRVAIFIDGDFWHGGQWETRGLRRLEQQFTRTETRDYWLRKIRRTMQRDATATASLQAMGWTALRFWESDVRRALDACVGITVGVLDAPDHARAYTPLAEKSVALRSPQAEVWRQGLESLGWRVEQLTPDEDSRGRPVTLEVRELRADRWQSASPLVLLDGRLEALLADAGRDLERALLALTERGYTVDAFAGVGDGADAADWRRLIVVGARSPSRGDLPMRERRSAYTTETGPEAVRPPELVEFIRDHSQIAWRPRSLPPPPDAGAGAAEGVAWIASDYLNPLLNELLRGQPLYPAP